MAAEAERLERLVDDVLDLAKLDAHRFTVLPRRSTWAVSASAPTRPSPRRRVGATSTTRWRSDGAPVIVSDGDRVLQIVSNLLSNAFRWTPDGGRIDLEVAGHNGTVTVDVADRGPGIAQEEQERIFRPFWSSDGRGTGLGLPIARELAVALGRPHRAGDRARAGQPVPARATALPVRPPLVERVRRLLLVAAPVREPHKPKAVGFVKRLAGSFCWKTQSVKPAGRDSFVFASSARPTPRPWSRGWT